MSSAATVQKILARSKRSRGELQLSISRPECGTLRPPAYAQLHLHTRAKDSAQTVKPDVCRCAAVKKKHSPSSAISTINFLRRKFWFWCLACDVALELVWVPTWRIQRMPFHRTSRSKIGILRFRSCHLHRPRSSRQFMPLRNWICSVNRCRPRRIQPVNMCGRSDHPGSSTAREQVLPVVKMKPRKPTSDDRLKTVDAMKKHRIKNMELRTSPAPSASPSLRVGSVHRLGSPCLWNRNQTTGETNCCIVQVTSKDILDRNGRFLREVETSWCRTLCPQLRNVMMGPLQSSKIFESQRRPWARRALQSWSSRLTTAATQRSLDL